MAFCGNCGMALRDGADICDGCGAPAVAVEKLSLFRYFVKCLKRYADFRGRARRREFFGYFIFQYIFSTALTVLYIAILAIMGVDWYTFINENYLWYTIAGICVWELALFVPDLAVSVRRLHDVGKSGWTEVVFLTGMIGSCSTIAMVLIDIVWLDKVSGIGMTFLAFLSSIGVYYSLILVCMDSERGANAYGVSPKYPNDNAPEHIDRRKASVKAALWAIILTAVVYLIWAVIFGIVFGYGDDDNANAASSYETGVYIDSGGKALTE